MEEHPARVSLQLWTAISQNSQLLELVEQFRLDWIRADALKMAAETTGAGEDYDLSERAEVQLNELGRDLAENLVNLLDLTAPAVQQNTKEL